MPITWTTGGTRYSARISGAADVEVSMQTELQSAPSFLYGHRAAAILYERLQSLDVVEHHSGQLTDLRNRLAIAHDRIDDLETSGRIFRERLDTMAQRIGDLEVGP